VLRNVDPLYILYSNGMKVLGRWGFTWWGAGPGYLGDRSPPVRSRGKAPVGGLGDFVPQKLKQNVKLVYNF